MLQRDRYKMPIAMGLHKQTALVFVRADKGMLYFWLEKSISCASSGSAQGPEHWWAGEERPEACGGRKGGSEGSAVIISQQLCDHQTDHQDKAEKMSKSQRPLQSPFQQTGIYLLSSHVSTIQILQTNCSQEQSSSQLNALLLGPSKETFIFTSINLINLYAIWRQIYLLVSKKPSN